MPKVMNGWGLNRNRVVVSLCDYSGNWPRPWNELFGYTVLHYDLKHGDDVTLLSSDAVLDEARAACNTDRPEIDCILAAPVCTTFTNAGARHWPEHEVNGTRALGVRLVEACLRLVRELEPRVWALENPVGRLPRLVPAVGSVSFYFDPSDYAGYVSDAVRAVSADDSVEAIMASNLYTKKTGIWGECEKPLTAPLAPLVYSFVSKDGTVKRGSVIWAKLGGKSERTKELRSMTPMGFARAFACANAIAAEGKLRGSYTPAREAA